MNGPMQTCQASSTMVTQAAVGTIISSTILPLIQSFINKLGEEAQQVQQSSV